MSRYVERVVRGTSFIHIEMHRQTVRIVQVLDPKTNYACSGGPFKFRFQDLCGFQNQKQEILSIHQSMEELGLTIIQSISNKRKQQTRSGLGFRHLYVWYKTL